MSFMYLLFVRLRYSKLDVGKRELRHLQMSVPNKVEVFNLWYVKISYINQNETQEPPES